MPTLREVWRAVCPSAEWLSATADPGPEVAWVRVVRARVPALEGLEAGDLAILPEGVLDALVAGGAEAEALLADLAGAGVSGLLLVGDGQVSLNVGALVDAARAAALPVLRATSVDGASLERSIVGFLVNRRAELERQATRIEAQLERLALLGRDLDVLAAAVGSFVGRAIAIEDERGAPILLNAPSGVPEAAAAASRYLVQPRAVALRIALPGVGHLVLLGVSPATELDRVVAERVAPLIALQISREAEVRRARDAGRSERLPPAGPPWVVIVARQIVPGQESALEERGAARERLARLAPARRLLLRGDVTSVEFRVVAATSPADPLGLQIAGRVVETIGRIAAVSRPFATSDGRSAAEAEARATLEAAEALPPAHGKSPGGEARVVRADRLAAYRLLGDLHNLPAGRRLADALLAPLLAGRPAQRTRRLQTLGAALDHGSAAEAAAALGIHRNTLLYRLRRIQQLTGWDLEDPELRFALALALRFVQNSQ